MNDPSTVNKLALLIGINQYPKLSQERWLAGCINDVEVMGGLLQANFGFADRDITILRDDKANRDSILAALNEIAARVGKGDIIVVHYSGHGSQMTDREGDEPDGLDETIVPYDSGRGLYPNRDITDDEIHDWLVRVTQVTPFVTLIFDCCHSGTISRDAFGDKSRWVEPDRRPVEELPPPPFATRAVRRGVGPSGWLPLSERYVLIAGCLDDESSYEHAVRQEGQTIRHGALTYFLTQELVKAEPGATCRDVFERVGPLVTAAYSQQHPQMEGARDREIFGIHHVQPMRFVPVKSRQNDLVILDGGAAHGLQTKSQWSVYPQGIKQVNEDIQRQGLVEITSVRAASCDAKIIDEPEPGSIAKGARAVEFAHFYGEMRWVVDVNVVTGFEEPSGKLQDLIGESELLRIAEPGQLADVRIYLVPPRFSAAETDPIPQLGAVGQPTWAVVNRDGRLMMPLHAVSEATAAFDLVENLEKAVRYQQALVLRNPNDGSALKGKVQFILKRKAADGNWVPAPLDAASGYVVFEEGDQIAAEMVNNYTQPVYVTVLDFGLTGAICQIYPPSGAAEKLLPGKSIETGVRAGDEITLYLPDNFPYEPDPTDKTRTPAGGTETFKLFATTHPADFSLLTQSQYRGIDRNPSKGYGTPLGQLLDLALTGHGTRDVRRNQVSPDEEWTIVERSFMLHRKAF